MQDLNPFQWAVRPLVRYAVFDGRAPRAEYWWYTLGAGILGFLLGAVDAAFLHGHIYGKYGPLDVLLIVALLAPGMAVLVRRLHDTGRTGWWALIRVPYYVLLASGSSIFHPTQAFNWLPSPAGLILEVALAVVGFVILIFVVQPGDEGPNPRPRRHGRLLLT